MFQFFVYEAATQHHTKNLHICFWSSLSERDVARYTKKKWWWSTAWAQATRISICSSTCTQKKKFFANSSFSPSEEEQVKVLCRWAMGMHMGKIEKPATGMHIDPIKTKVENMHKGKSVQQNKLDVLERVAKNPFPILSPITISFTGLSFLLCGNSEKP